MGIRRVGATCGGAVMIMVDDLVACSMESVSDGRPLPPPLDSFTSVGGRAFTIADGAHSSRYEADPLWFDTWPILFDGAPAGKLYRSLDYGRTADGQPRWHATIRELYWTHASGAPTGVGFDVAAFDTAEQACAAWARSADQILDWSEGKPVVGSYGVVRRVAVDKVVT